MRKLLSFFFMAFITLGSSAQTGFFSNKHTYKVDGYILVGTDTVSGLIAIPISNNELDYNSLCTSVTFIDSSNKIKKYKPLNILGFGLRDEGVLGDYISISRSEGLNKNLFLKKIVEGKIALLENKLDRNVTRTSYGSNVSYNQSINESIFYVKVGQGILKKVPFNSKTSTVKKKDIKQLVSVLSDDFVNSEEEVDISGLISILSNYNAKERNK